MSRYVRASFIGLLLLTACVAEEAPSPSPTPTLAPTPSPTVAPPPSEPASTPASPTPSPEPSLSLDLPDELDRRMVSATVASDIGEDGGTMTITVTSLADDRIDELVLRWPTDLRETLFLSPFTPTEERIRDFGDPLVQPWTKWVIGPGEQGEPEGTTSLGWGPLLSEATLTIELDVTREAPGPVAFDLQLLARNDLLQLEDGEPAEIRVEVP